MDHLVDISTLTIDFAVCLALDTLHAYDSRDCRVVLSKLGYFDGGTAVVMNKHRSNYKVL